MTDGSNASGKPTGWKTKIKAVVGVAILFGIILYSTGIGRERVKPGQVNASPGLPLPADAATMIVKAESVAPLVDVVGTVSSELKVNLSARMQGYVKEIFVSAGSAVTNGQVLLTLDEREIKEQATAAESQFKLAETELARTGRLFEKQAATEQMLTAARSQHEIARAQLDRALVMRTYAVIRSPLNGTVTDRRVEPGDLANPGQILLAVYDPVNMQLEAPVPVRLLGKLPIGRAVEVVLDRMDKRYKGTVRQIVSEIDPLSRTQLVKVRLEELKGELILPGTFGRLWVEDEPRRSFLIPAGAVYSVGQIDMVQVASHGRAVRRAVRVGLRVGDRIEVLSGLAEGDVVLLNPAKGE